MRRSYFYHMIFPKKYWTDGQCKILRINGQCYLKSIYDREGGDIRLFITLVPKGFKTFSYSLDYHQWIFLINFDWLVHLVECPNVSTTNCNLEKG